MYLLLVLNLTRPVDEVTVAQAGDLHPLQEEHRGRDVRLHNMWPSLRRKPSVLWVQTKALALSNLNLTRCSRRI